MLDSAQHYALCLPQGRAAGARPPFSEATVVSIVLYVALITQSSNCWKVNNL